MLNRLWKTLKLLFKKEPAMPTSLPIPVQTISGAYTLPSSTGNQYVTIRGGGGGSFGGGAAGSGGMSGLTIIEYMGDRPTPPEAERVSGSYQAEFQRLYQGQAQQVSTQLSDGQFLRGQQQVTFGQEYIRAYEQLMGERVSWQMAQRMMGHTIEPLKKEPKIKRNLPEWF